MKMLFVVFVVAAFTTIASAQVTLWVPIRGYCNLQILSPGSRHPGADRRASGRPCSCSPREKTTVSSATNVYATVTDPRIYAHPREETSALGPRYRGILSFAVAMESHNQGTALITWPANLHLATNRILIVGKQERHLAMPRALRSLSPLPFMKLF